MRKVSFIGYAQALKSIALNFRSLSKIPIARFIHMAKLNKCSLAMKIYICISQHHGSPRAWCWVIVIINWCNKLFIDLVLVRYE